MDKKLKRWRTNCVVTYGSHLSVTLHRDTILAVLRGIATLRGVECKIAFAYPFLDDEMLQEYANLREHVSDLVYFRSSYLTKISSKDFRKIIEHVFDDSVWMRYTNSYEVGFQMQKFLPKYPFPD